MANSIALVSKCIPLLDEIYANESITQVLESSSSLVRQGANAHEAQIPKISMDGLADYSRGGGYVDGDVTLSWETVQFDYDRGRAFNVDAMDNEETIGLAFGRLSGEFLRTKVIPELDAYRFAKLAGASGVTLESESISTGDAACTYSQGKKVQSESNGKYSVSYAVPSVTESNAGLIFRKECIKYLGDTGLMYRGVSDAD